MKEIIIDKSEENKLKEFLAKRGDAEAGRMMRYINMPDLSRTPGSPLNDIINRVKQIPLFADFFDINIPEVVDTHILFDLFNMGPEHPARSKSDTYYVDDTHVLRTHDTVMWHYFLNHPEVKEKIAKKEDIGVICYAKVYRKDEIDRHHMNVFHQFGGMLLVPDEKRTITGDDLKNVLSEVAKAIFGENVKYRFNDDKFPYTDPSYEMEIEVNGQWVEMVGCGLPRKDVLKNFGLEGYNGWAFGFGLERLAIASMSLPDIRLLWSEDARVVKQLKLDQKFQEVSKYPPIIRDISFIVKNDFVPNDYFDLIRDIGGDLVEEVQLLDKYENETKFGKGMVSYTYRVIYRSPDRTLKAEEVEPLQNKLYEETKNIYNAQLR